MSWGDVERALEAPADRIGIALAALAEDQWFDRKSGRIRARDLAPTLVAFANAEGGCIVVGIHDGTLDGVSSAKANELRQASVDHTIPPVRIQCAEVHCEPVPGESATLMVIRVDPGERVYELKNGDCYLRVGDESRRLTFNQRQELEYDRGQAPYDGTLIDASMADLSAERIDAYRTAAGAKRDTRHVLRSLSLAGPRDEVTLAGYLMFADHPQDRFPHAHVRVLRYSGTERRTGTQQNLLDSGDIRCEGPIPDVITKAAEAISQLLPRRRALGAERRFVAQPIVPDDAWLEGLVNAVVHRSYSAAGDYVRIEIFDDRVEIESPGRFPGIVDPALPLRISRYARNPRITRVCADLRITQELGEGIARIFNEMRARGLTDPIYRQTAGSVRLVLSSADAIPPAVLKRLPAGARDTLDALRRAARPLGTGEVIELVGLSRPTVKLHLDALRDVGLVSWRGKSAKDPRATWSADSRS